MIITDPNTQGHTCMCVRGAGCQSPPALLLEELHTLVPEVPPTSVLPRPTRTAPPVGRMSSMDDSSRSLSSSDN